MPSVLAIISKKVFQALPVGRVGEVAPLDRYQSKNAAFAKLGADDALVLVTVPKDDVLWLVAILDKAKQRGDAVVGATNTMPITDISSRLSQLVLADGAGIKAKPGKLAMSLQTPRVLADADVALLRGGAPRKAGPTAKPIAMDVSRGRKRKSANDATDEAPALRLKGGKLSARARALVEQVYKSPDDRALRGVLADQLLEDQHVWGELISLQTSDPKRHATRIEQIIRQHAREVVGAIANVAARGDLEIEDGFLVRCRTGKSKSWTSAAERNEAAKAREWATVREVDLTYEVPGSFATLLLQNPASSNLTKITSDEDPTVMRATPRDPWRIVGDGTQLESVLAGLSAKDLERIPPPTKPALREILEIAREKRTRKPKRR